MSTKRPTPATSRPSFEQLKSRWLSPVEAIIIASSTGGPDALEVVLSGLSNPLPVPVLIVQHVLATVSGALARRLSQRTGHPVVEASHGDLASPGAVLLARGDFHLRVQRLPKGPCCALNKRPPVNQVRPAADELLRSAAEVWGAGMLAVVLTGAGSDGREGCRAVRAAGGRVIAQDEASSTLWGMPGAVVGADLAHAVLPLPGIPLEITRRLRLSAPGDWARRASR